jgi:hypothetical protein
MRKRNNNIMRLHINALKDYGQTSGENLVLADLVMWTRNGALD